VGIEPETSRAIDQNPTTTPPGLGPSDIENSFEKFSREILSVAKNFLGAIFVVL